MNDIVINEKNLSRFNKRLKKALEEEFGSTTLNVAEKLFAKALGVDSVHALKKKISEKETGYYCNQTVSHFGIAGTMERIKKLNEKEASLGAITKMEEKFLGHLKDGESRSSIDIEIESYIEHIKKIINDYNVQIKKHAAYGIYFVFDDETKILLDYVKTNNLNREQYNFSGDPTTKINLKNSIIFEKVSNFLKKYQGISLEKAFETFVEEKNQIMYSDFIKISKKNLFLNVFKKDGSNSVISNVDYLYLPYFTETVRIRNSDIAFIEIKHEEQILFNIIINELSERSEPEKISCKYQKNDTKNYQILQHRHHLYIDDMTLLDKIFFDQNIILTD